MFIAPHRHEVTLGLQRTELFVERGLREGMSVSLRLPYDRKDVDVRYTTFDGQTFIPPYGDIHHRDQVLTGVSDSELLLHFGLPWTAAGKFEVFTGLTLPFGKTQPDPIELGERGEEHEHIQFGSGTADPKIGARWSRRVGRLMLIANADGRISTRENPEGFRAPSVYRWSTGASIRVPRGGVALLLQGQYQTIGRWSGRIDEGTGFNNGGIRLQWSIPIGSYVVTPGIYAELYSRSLHHDESFNQSETLSLSITRTF